MKAEKWVPFIKHIKLKVHKVKLRRVYHLLLYVDFLNDGYKQYLYCRWELGLLCIPNTTCCKWLWFLGGFALVSDWLFFVAFVLWQFNIFILFVVQCSHCPLQLYHCIYVIIPHHALKPMHQGYKFIISWKLGFKFQGCEWVPNHLVGHSRHMIL